MEHVGQLDMMTDDLLDACVHSIRPFGARTQHASLGPLWVCAGRHRSNMHSVRDGMKTRPNTQPLKMDIYTEVSGYSLLLSYLKSR